MAKKEFELFKSDMDNWVKEFRRELNEHSGVIPLVEEHSENIDHNYEILQEMRAEMLKLREELSALRLVQLLHLKSELQKTKH